MEKDKEIRWNFRSYFEILEHSATSKWKQSFNKRGKSANIEDPLDGKQRIASVLFSLILVDGSCSLPKEYLNPWANEELSKLAKSAIKYTAKFIVYDKTLINDSYVKAAKLLAKKIKIFQNSLLTNVLFASITKSILINFKPWRVNA